MGELTSGRLAGIVVCAYVVLVPVAVHYSKAGARDVLYMYYLPGRVVRAVS